MLYIFWDFLYKFVLRPNPRLLSIQKSFKPKSYIIERLFYLNLWWPNLILSKHIARIKCCPVWLVIVMQQRLSWIDVLNCQNYNQCLKCLWDCLCILSIETCWIVATTMLWMMNLCVQRKAGWKAIRDKRKHYKPGGTMQTSEVNKWTFRSRIGSLGTLGDIIFDILEPPAV